MTDIITKNQEETFKSGREFAAKLKGGEIIALYGDLGAGKTTFTSGVVDYFLKGKRVLSPTFIIVRHYFPEHNPITQLVHIDLYRLQNTAEIEDLGLTEYAGNPGIVVLIEWADKMKELLPGKRTDIFFKRLSDSKRKLSIIVQ